MNDILLVLELSIGTIAIAMIFITAVSIGYMAWNVYKKRRV
jgi:hypothetical protein